MRRLAIAAVAAALIQAPLGAQTLLDRGTLILVRGGGEAGRVEFAVRTTTGSAAEGGQLAIGTTRTPAHEIQYALETDRLLAPLNYTLTESAAGHVVRRISAQVAPPRLSVHAVTDAGETSRELPARAPLVIMADEDFTAYFFLPRPDAGERRTLNVFRVESMTSVSATVTGEGDDNVGVGAQPIPCRRYTLQLSNGERAQYWFNLTGSLIKVTAPSGLIATRAQAPTQ